MFPFTGPLLINKNSAIEQLLQNNHKNRSRPKDFNKNIDTTKTSPPQATIDFNKPKVKSVQFEHPYNHINSIDNTHK